MTIDTLRRFFLPCFFPTTTPTTTITKKPLASSNHHPTTTKKRISTSLRHNTTTNTTTQHHSPSSSSSTSTTSGATAAPPRPSKSMVIGTIFGNRRGHVWFCIQHDRLSTKPILLLELPLSTNNLVREMRNGLVRIALECSPTRSDVSSCPLRSIPVWTAFCNGRKTGFAARRRTGERVRSILRTMQCVTVGAGVIPSGFGSSGSGSEELMYMRANFEHVVGNADSESFHLINPDECPGQELSVFLLRSGLPVHR
ncbi:protein MIZU-KUSSEI 1 [Gastrolobium bilobum]|uniref:protein MIZU-KUSSEI 1 n=1 Tax=Gastrolobium bilobum TaxID=150636 RepID=UPI002AB0D833|nr:protein MIZU-KUSSEI 1 [Gastrolobium bilobum]